MRDRLIELINNLANGEEPIIEGLEDWSDTIADYLLDNGVVVIDTDVVSHKNRPLITQCFGIPLDEMIEIISDNSMSTTRVMEGTNRFKTIKYKPTCKYGCEDCIYDPAYIKATYPEWYLRLYGNQTPKEASQDPQGCVLCTESHWMYDDEDK